MADRDGFHSDGTVHIPAIFRGTVRLVEGSPPAPAPLPGTFSMQLDITFAMLLETGFVPVHPAHRAYPRYLEAHVTRDPFSLRDQTDHPRLDDFGAFLDFVGDPHRHASPSRGVPAALPGLDPVAGFPGLPGEPGIDGLPVLPAILPLNETEKRNIADLADLIWTEARGAGEAAMIAVGWALPGPTLRIGMLAADSRASRGS